MLKNEISEICKIYAIVYSTLLQDFLPYSLMIVVLFLALRGLYQSWWNWQSATSWRIQLKLLTTRNMNLIFPIWQEFSLLDSVQTGPGAHPAPCPLGIGGNFPGGKAVGAWSWPLTSIYCWGQEWWSCTSTPSYVFMVRILRSSHGGVWRVPCFGL
jgi:hypothetical protein